MSVHVLDCGMISGMYCSCSASFKETEEGQFPTIYIEISLLPEWVAQSCHYLYKYNCIIAVCWMDPLSQVPRAHRLNRFNASWYGCISISFYFISSVKQKFVVCFSFYTIINSECEEVLCKTNRLKIIKLTAVVLREGIVVLCSYIFLENIRLK